MEVARLCSIGSRGLMDLMGAKVKAQFREPPLALGKFCRGIHGFDCTCPGWRCKPNRSWARAHLPVVATYLSRPKHLYIFARNRVWAPVSHSRALLCADSDGGSDGTELARWRLQVAGLAAGLYSDLLHGLR